MFVTQPAILYSSSSSSSAKPTSSCSASAYPRRSRRRSSSTRHDKYTQETKPSQRSAAKEPTKKSTTDTERTRNPTNNHKTGSSTPKKSSQLRRDNLLLLRLRNLDMTLDSTSVQSISALAATARSLFRLAKVAGPDFADVASAVRALHTVIKHLRAEAEDPDSLLNSAQQESSVYARQLTPIVEDTDFTLKQLATILTNCGLSTDEKDGKNDGMGKHIEDRERDMLQLIRTKLANQKTNIDIFLDTVQLHNPSRQHRPVDLKQTDAKQQDSIKDKIDIVAQRLFQRRARARASGDVAEESEEEMWQQFWAELVKEGFSSDVLRKHKEVLRAYIRELEENGSVDDEPPSVRGLLDHANNSAGSGAAYAPHQYPPYPDVPTSAYPASRQQYGSSPLPPPVAIPASYQPAARGDMSPKELVSPAMDNEKFAPGVKLGRPRPEQGPPVYHDSIGDATAGQGQYNTNSAPPPKMPIQLSYERYSSDSTTSDSDSSGSQQLALISTQDLMDSDRHEADHLAARVGGLQLSPALLPLPANYGVSPSTSPSGRYLPPPPPSTSFKGPLNHPPELNLSASPGKQAFGSSPRYIPPLAAAYGSSPTTSSTMSPPPPYTSAPLSIPPASAPAASTLPPPPTGGTPQRTSRLAPDSKGSEIPLEAKWTRIKRTLVSPEVLENAGLRYEARPDFVAVLGVLSKDQIAYFARKSAEVRATRARGYSGSARTIPVPAPVDEKRSRGKNSPPLRHSEATASDDERSVSSSALWDESDDEASEDGPARGSTTDKYIPREYRRQHRQQQEQRRRARHDSATAGIHEEPTDASSNGSGTRVYPVIVSPPSASTTSPSATVAPKPILKNRNENRVHFDESGPFEMSPAEAERERERRERRERRRESERRRKGDRERERDRDRDHDREKHRERDRDRDHHHSSSHTTRHRGEREREESARDKRRVRKSVWGETLGAVGIGGAAASLLSVLTEAAAGF